ADLNNWNCNNSCLQALALSPRSETGEGRGGRSPMISPRASPQLLRRGTVPVAPPPPLPPRRSSPTLGSPTSSPNTNFETVSYENLREKLVGFHQIHSTQQINVKLMSLPFSNQNTCKCLNISLVNTADVTITYLACAAIADFSMARSMRICSEEGITDAPPPPCTCTVTIVAQDMEEPEHSCIGVADTRYDILQTSSSSISNSLNKVTMSSSSHIRHQSCPSLPSSSAATMLPSKSSTTPMFPPPLPPPTVPVIPVASTSSAPQQRVDSNSASSLQRQHSGGNSHTIHYAELADISEEPSYENTIIIPGSIQEEVHKLHLEIIVVAPKKQTEAQKQHYQRSSASEGNVAYENLNMDYIAKLTSEGYAQDAVIRALGITRNNVDMAWDILHEFATKQTTTMCRGKKKQELTKRDLPFI
ncbi:hypothetical protein L9F63_013461, partial [Diploptera punctata]